MNYYLPDLAWIHDAGYSFHAKQTAPGIIRILRDGGLTPGNSVVDVGCGSGLLAAELLEAGFAVHGIDASEAMIALARAKVPRATFDVMRLPTGVEAGRSSGLPEAKAIVSTGHVLNYLESRDCIRQALGELARAIQPGGVIAIDLMTEQYCEARDIGQVHAKVEDEWLIVTRFSRPQPYRYDRAITVFRLVEGLWRRSDECHRNTTFDAEEALQILRANRVEAQLRPAFGSETLREGLVVLTGVRD
jgi:SAM-dependent methyltransferase